MKQKETKQETMSKEKRVVFLKEIMVSQNQRAAGRSDDKIWEKRRL